MVARSRLAAVIESTVGLQYYDQLRVVLAYREPHPNAFIDDICTRPMVVTMVKPWDGEFMEIEAEVRE